MRVCNNPGCMSIHNVMYITQSDTIGIAHAEVMYVELQVNDQFNG